MFERVKKVANQSDLIREITEKAKELEKFPRMNRHCVDWYDKYSSKFNDLSLKFNDQEEAEKGIHKLLTDLDV